MHSRHNSLKSLSERWRLCNHAGPVTLDGETAGARPSRKYAIDRAPRPPSRAQIASLGWTPGHTS
jgi:hypothetical protein